jgi:hypothetical protein
MRGVSSGKHDGPDRCGGLGSLVLPLILGRPTPLKEVAQCFTLTDAMS